MLVALAKDSFLKFFRLLLVSNLRFFLKSDLFLETTDDIFVFGMIENDSFDGSFTYSSIYKCLQMGIFDIVILLILLGIVTFSLLLLLIL